MDRRVKIIIGGAVALLLLIVLAIFFFLSNITKETDTAEQNGLDSLPTLSDTESSPTPAPVRSANTANTKVHSGEGFSLRYPNSWGLLSCSNSNNFEFDPLSASSTTIVCNEAQKPITVLVTNNLNCQGTASTLGNVTVIKFKDTDANNYVSYRWCVPLSGGRALDITHRVDPNVSQATSKEDYSSQVEEMIKTISTAPQGS